MLPSTVLRITQCRNRFRRTRFRASREPNRGRVRLRARRRRPTPLVFLRHFRRVPEQGRYVSDDPFSELLPGVTCDIKCIIF